MNQVYVCATYFQVYVSILKSTYKTDKESKSLIIINDHTPGIEKIFPALLSNGLFDYLLQVPFRELKKRFKKENNFLSKIINRNRLALEFVEANSDILKYNEFIRNAEINLFSNFGLTPVYILLKYKKNYIRQLEEGEGNYVSRVGYLQAFKRKYLLNTVVGDGLDEEVKELQVQFPEKLPTRLRKKGKKLELKKMEDDLSDEQRKKVLDVFMSGLEIDLTGKKKLLLITQSLSEDNHMTEERKVQMYNQLLDRYANEYSIYLKPHPRELTDYSGKLKYNFTLIPGGFPLEMFDLLKGINFELGITVCSSALYNMRCVEKKIILGRTYLKKQLPDNWHELDFINTIE